MKAVILVAGDGTRLRPLTETTHKSLLPLGNTTILGKMMGRLIQAGIRDFIFVTGYREEDVKKYVGDHFPDVGSVFVRNNIHDITNTGYSLLLAKEYIEKDDFIKLDGDVVFDPDILDLLLKNPHPNVLCMDRSTVDDEVIKVRLGSDNQALDIGKHVALDKAAGESIGIEKISREYISSLFEALGSMMQDSANYEEYYEAAYSKLVQGDFPFFAIDITGKKWCEIDNIGDYNEAQKLAETI